MRLKGILSEYIEEHKVTDAAEIPIPSVEQEFHIAANFNQESV